MTEVASNAHPAKEPPHVTGEQIRAAYSLLGWSRPEFAKRSGVSISTVRRFEEGGPGSKLGLRAMVESLEAAGVEFIQGGVRWKGGEKPQSAASE